MTKILPFTPRPWTIETATKYTREIFAEQCQSLVATAHGDTYMSLPSELNANARLIASAPDLYIALTNALDCLHDILVPCEGDNCPCILHEIEAALAKAEGAHTHGSR